MSHPLGENRRCMNTKMDSANMKARTLLHLQSQHFDTLQTRFDTLRHNKKCFQKISALFFSTETDAFSQFVLNSPPRFAKERAMQNGTDRAAAKALKYIDLFCGIGGFRQAMENLSRKMDVASQCVFSSDIDEDCRQSYASNFGDTPVGDIKQVHEKDVPKHDLLLAGFPCQPFSIIGRMRGFDDTRGTLFFDIARILNAQKPRAFVLENVKLLVGHNKGQTLQRILETIRELGYECQYQVLNALDFGLPQKRERVFIVGYQPGIQFEWPKGGAPMKPLGQLLEREVDRKHYASDHIRNRRWSVLQPTREPTIWHENKAGHISAYPWSCALRAGASYNYLLVNGERRLTPREMFRLQGFPDSYRIVSNDSQARKQAGNSVPVPVVQAVIRAVMEAHGWLSKSANGLNGKTHPKNYGRTQAATADGRKIRTAVSA
jgi:DNA (cytosine-5)-methyltransferase 1